MASVTFDGRSFMIDGRRLWLVGGALHYSRIPRDHWRDAINAAKQAGLNTICVPVFWHRHEPRPGQFDFKGDNDLRHFVELIGAAGMHCILKPGPYVGEDADAGGLPAWVLAIEGARPRKASGPLLEACSRYLSAVADKVKDLQASARGGGPIILVQNESSWTCGDDKAAAAYLGEINRYLREAGFGVPIINTNNLWQGIEGEIDCWSGAGDLLAVVRQLGVVKPGHPRLVEVQIGATSVWGAPAPPAPAGAALQHQLAQVFAAGGQAAISPFHGGTNFGFWGGRHAEGPASFAATGREHGAPLTETLGRAASFGAVRRLCTFASRFGRVLAHLEPSFQPIVPAPHLAEKAGREPGVPVVVHGSGTQGSVAFVFHGTTGSAPTTLLLPDGSSLAVPGREASGPHSDAVSWCLFNVSLSGRATLDYCNLSVLLNVGTVVVVFGPSGAEGHLSINGSPLHAVVPAGREPTVIRHEGMTVVVCSASQADTVFASDDAVYVGVWGLDAESKPVALPGSRHARRFGADGVETEVALPPSPAAQAVKSAPSRVGLSHWSWASAGDYTDGTSARFASIDGPADLTKLGCPYGLGWYRVKFKPRSAGRTSLAFPGGGDRLHVFLDGAALGVAGLGPGASAEVAATLKRKPQTLVLLAENLGRLAGGANMGEPRGVPSAIWQVAPLRVPRATLKNGDPIEVLAAQTPLWEVHAGDTTSAERVTWLLRRARKAPVIMDIGVFVGRGLVLVNDKPVRFLERGSQDRVVLAPELLSRATNAVQIALLREPGPDGRMPDAGAVLRQLSANVSFSAGYESIGDQAEWAFARWEPPAGSQFHDKGGRRPHGPVWWRASFTPASTQAPLLFEPVGLTKGQFYVNNRHVGRYFVATATGRPVPPQTRYYIPGPWLAPDAENTLLVFDEHGGDPRSARLVYGEPRA